jgi:excisionase family DNA binding protein
MSTTRHTLPQDFAELSTTSTLQDIRAVTVQKAAEIIGVSVGSIWKFIAKGDLESTTVGRRRLVYLRSLERLMTSGARTPGEGCSKPTTFKHL